LLGAAIVMIACAALLWRTIFDGRSQSFDTLLYARGLWGIAHGEGWNSVVDMNTFSLHAHFGLLGLAPLAWIMPSAAVLILAQAFCLACVFALIVRSVQTSHGTGMALWAAGLTITSPLVLNGFLFDARPDLVGVGFCTAALLRARKVGFDIRSVVFLALATLCREEFALVAAIAFVAAPKPIASMAVPFRVRVVYAASFSAYFLLYYFVVMHRLGGNTNSAAMHLAQTGNIGGPELVRAKIDLAVVFALTSGGLIWLGSRWLLVALPGLALLAITRWLPDMQLRFHYSMFAVPGLVLASVSGLERVRDFSAKRRGAILVMTSLLAIANFRYGSAAPGGLRFARFNFDLADREGGIRFDWNRHSVGYDAVHSLLARVPRSHGLVAPWSFAAPVADRYFITTEAALFEQIRRSKAIDARITTIALMREDLAPFVSTLQSEGFMPVGPIDAPIILVSRAPKDFSVASPAIRDGSPTP
jgi:uncharacterized membrane protein